MLEFRFTILKELQNSLKKCNKKCKKAGLNLYADSATFSEHIYLHLHKNHNHNLLPEKNIKNSKNLCSYLLVCSFTGFS